MIDTKLVQNLIATQFPQWNALPITPVQNGGWDNRTFHLGTEMVIRMPSDKSYAMQVEKEQLWLPLLAPHLPLSIPSPIAMGAPSNAYPYHWSIYRWIEGRTIEDESPSAKLSYAKELANFLSAFHKIKTEGGPPPGYHSFHRGGNLSHYTPDIEKALSLLEGKMNTAKAKSFWSQAASTKWTHPPVWVHGDLSPTNLLANHETLTAVIDFGQLTIGDPACDLSIAWTYFDPQSSKVFRSSLVLDEATWLRGKAWALWKALILASGLIKGPDREMIIAQKILFEDFTLNK
ncbi:MAG: aminoglycoside phosphotransferase family protein [Chlamydiales bacterium]|nr:aminoglycoside phosphotransferase family protein [Chlamydiales bacterium]